MIAQLTGFLVEKNLTEVVLDVHGVGYQLFIPLSTYDRLPAAGQQLSLYTYLGVREDALLLYGFATKEERALFLLLINAVSGVGAKIALNILSAVTVDCFSSYVSAGDVKALSRINGIGKKTAERIIVELKDKLKGAGSFAALSAGTTSPEQSDAVAALVTLGYKQESAEKAIQSILASDPEKHPSAEQLIRLALAKLNL